MNILQLTSILDNRHQRAEDVISLMRGFSLGMEGLSFAAGGLGHDGDKLIKIMRGVPSNFSSISLRGASLYGLSSVHFVQMLQAIPPHVTHLSMELNPLHKYTTVELIEIMGAFPETVRHINLFRNAIGEGRTADEMLSILQPLLGVSQSRTINLGDNFLHLFGAPEEVVFLLNQASQAMVQHCFMFKDCSSMPPLANVAPQFEEALAQYLPDPAPDIKRLMGLEKVQGNLGFFLPDNKTYFISSMENLNNVRKQFSAAEYITQGIDSASATSNVFMDTVY